MLDGEKFTYIYASPPLSPAARRTTVDTSLATTLRRRMDNDRQLRRIDPPQYGTSSRSVVRTPPSYTPTSAPERYNRGAAAALQSPAQSTAGARGQGYNYSFGEGAQFVPSAGMQSSGVPYQTEYGESGQRQVQQAYSYGSNLMYNVGGQPQNAQPASYDTGSQYPARETAALGVLSSQFGVPQQYFASGESASASGIAPSIPTLAPQQQQLGSQYPSLGYSQQPAVSRQAAPASVYTGGIADQAQGLNLPALTQPEPATSTSDAWHESAHEEYQNALLQTFQYTLDSRLADAAQSLLQLSSWLAGNAENLGLVRDEPAMHAERLKLWQQFNYCWLTLLQRQKDLTYEMMTKNRKPVAPASLIDVDFLEKMGKDLIRFCDGLEKHGLVDYEMGIWEEQIILLLKDCLDLLEDTEPQASSGAEKNSSGR